MSNTVDFEFQRIIRELRKSGEAEKKRADALINLFWSRWGLERDANTLAVFKLAAPWFEDFFPNRLISETDLANAVFFYHRFCRRFRFEGINRDKVSELSEAVTPMPMRELRGEAAAIPPPPEPEDWFLWVATGLGLPETKDWADLKIAVDEMAAMHHSDSDDHDRAELLLRAIETILWNRQRRV